MRRVVTPGRRHRCAPREGKPGLALPEPAAPAWRAAASCLCALPPSSAIGGAEHGTEFRAAVSCPMRHDKGWRLQKSSRIRACWARPARRHRMFERAGRQAGNGDFAFDSATS